MDLIQVIEAEHRSVERLFERFERAVRAENLQEQGELARRIARELSLHASTEEEVLYPALARAGMTGERLDALEDHHAVKLALSELAAMAPANERFAAKMHVVEKSVRRHVEEEESTLLTQLRAELDPDEVQRLGTEFETVRRTAPTRPHPLSPDMPPANMLANAGASVVDRLLDAVREGGQMLRALARQLAGRAVRVGREAADRTRHDGLAIVEQARERGGRALEQVRALGAGVAENAAERGAEAAEQIEHRTAQAARELRSGMRAAGTRARRGQRRAAATRRQASAKARRAGTTRRRRRA